MSEVNGVEVVLPPPPGYVVDFENPQRQYVRQYHGVYTGGMVLMVLFVAQNLYVRWWMQRRFTDPATSKSLQPDIYPEGAHQAEKPSSLSSYCLRIVRNMPEHNIMYVSAPINRRRSLTSNTLEKGGLPCQ